MHRSIFLLILVSLTLVGCRAPQTMKDAWKGTRSYYYDYLNTPAKLDMDDKGKILDHQAALGAAIADFDLQLQDLEKALQNSDRRPDAEWVTSMTTRFPWLSGIALTDEEGIPRAQVPMGFPKQFEIGNLLEVDPKQQIKDLRGFVQTHHLGAEIYLGNPVYIGEDFRGVIIMHFDPRVLLARTGDPGKVVIAGPTGIIWPGMYDIQSTPLAGIDWGEKVKKEYAGTVSNEHGTFYWISRYIGNLPLVYAIRVQGEFPVDESNMRSLYEANAYAIGRVDFSQMMQAPDSSPSEEPVELSPDGAASPLAPPAPAMHNDQTATTLSE
ncbi:MAG: hypothetical protein DELT_02166 [Desulfovibrio sp.]